jgi:hypothetical protein
MTKTFLAVKRKSRKGRRRRKLSFKVKHKKGIGGVDAIKLFLFVTDNSPNKKLSCHSLVSRYSLAYSQ